MLNSTTCNYYSEDIKISRRDRQLYSISLDTKLTACVINIVCFTSNVQWRQLEPQAVAVSPYGWLMTHYGWLAGLSRLAVVSTAAA